jgi:hypothetical protein
VVDTRRIHIGETSLAEVLDALHDASGQRVCVVEQIALKHVEAYVVVSPVAQEFAIKLEHLRRRVRFLGGDAEITLDSPSGKLGSGRRVGQ